MFDLSNSWSLLQMKSFFIQWLNNSCNSHLTEATIVDCPWDSEETFVITCNFKDTFITQRYLFTIALHFHPSSTPYKVETHEKNTDRRVYLMLYEGRACVLFF